MSIHSDFYFLNYQGENMDQILNPAFSGAQTKQGGLRKPIGLNDHNTLKSADHYGDQEKWEVRTGGKSTNYPDRKGKNRCIYRGFIKGPTGFVQNLEEEGPHEETD